MFMSEEISIVELERREKISTSLKRAYEEGRHLKIRVWKDRSHTEDSKAKMRQSRKIREEQRKDGKFPEKHEIERRKALSYILGCLHGDAWFDWSRRTNYYGIGLECKDLDFLNEFNEAMALYLGRSKNSIWLNNQSGCWRTKFSSKRMYFNLKDRTFKDFEDLIYECPAKFLRGLYDSEGWAVNGQRGSGNVSIASTNTDLIYFVKDLLYNKYGVVSFLHLRKPNKKPSVKKNGKKIYSKKPITYLTFYKRPYRQTFYDEIGFSIERKMKTLEDSL